MLDRVCTIWIAQGFGDKSFEDKDIGEVEGRFGESLSDPVPGSGPNHRATGNHHLLHLTIKSLNLLIIEVLSVLNG